MAEEINREIFIKNTKNQTFKLQEVDIAHCLLLLQVQAMMLAGPDCKGVFDPDSIYPDADVIPNSMPDTDLTIGMVFGQYHEPTKTFFACDNHKCQKWSLLGELWETTEPVIT